MEGCFDRSGQSRRVAFRREVISMRNLFMLIFKCQSSFIYHEAMRMYLIMLGFRRISLKRLKRNYLIQDHHLLQI